MAPIRLGQLLWRYCVLHKWLIFSRASQNITGEPTTRREWFITAPGPTPRQYHADPPFRMPLPPRVFRVKLCVYSDFFGTFVHLRHLVSDTWDFAHCGVIFRGLSKDPRRLLLGLRPRLFRSVARMGTRGPNFFTGSHQKSPGPRALRILGPPFMPGG